MEPMRKSHKDQPSPIASHPGGAMGAMDFLGKKVLVVGLGKSGLSVARFLSAQGASVTISELKETQQIDPDALREVSAMGVDLEAGGHRVDTFKKAQMVILSPGVPHDTELLRSVAAKGIPVMGEMELASRFIKTPMIAVTGTNGKSTVTTFVGAMLENAGLRAFVGGNIGTPLTSYAAGDQAADYVVAEVSSFQLDTIDTFCPLLSLVLNIAPDHLDRYPDYEAYARSKLRVFENQVPGQYVVLNDDDERLSREGPSFGPTLLRYGREMSARRNAFIEGGALRTRSEEGVEGPSFEIAGFRLPGAHNLENLLGCILVGCALRLPPAAIQKTIDEFPGLPHRIEWIREVEGVGFYDDSKATNVDAAVRAVSSFDRPLILIAGGRHKGSDYAPLVQAARGRVKAAIFLGEAKGLLASSFDGTVPFFLADDLDEAVSTAFVSAERGDIVLLAPACSSFDMFSDYAQRGRAFRTAVEGLIRP